MQQLEILIVWILTLREHREIDAGLTPVCEQERDKNELHIEHKVELYAGMEAAEVRTEIGLPAIWVCWCWPAFCGGNN